MGEKYLGDLLEELDKTSYSRTRSMFSKPKRTVGELEKNIPLDLIIEAFSSDLIRDANKPEKYRTFGRNIDKTIPCTLTITGFQYLNQIRIKKAIEDLNDSIDKFSKSSDEAYSELNDSITKFNESSDKYSQELISPTRAIYILTVIVTILTTYPLTKDLVDEKTIGLIPFFNYSNASSALVYAAIMAIVVVGVMVLVFQKIMKKR